MPRALPALRRVAVRRAARQAVRVGSGPIARPVDIGRRRASLPHARRRGSAPCRRRPCPEIAPIACVGDRPGTRWPCARTRVRRASCMDGFARCQQQRDGDDQQHRGSRPTRPRTSSRKVLCLSKRLQVFDERILIRLRQARCRKHGPRCRCRAGSRRICVPSRSASAPVDTKPPRTGS